MVVGNSKWKFEPILFDLADELDLGGIASLKYWNKKFKSIFVMNKIVLFTENKKLLWTFGHIVTFGNDKKQNYQKVSFVL